MKVAQIGAGKAGAVVFVTWPNYGTSGSVSNVIYIYNLEWFSLRYA